MFAFNFNLRRYTKAFEKALAQNDLQVWPCTKRSKATVGLHFTQETRFQIV